MEPLKGVVTGPRTGRMRDRRGRGKRGKMSLPGPLSPRGVPIDASRRDEFDRIVRDASAHMRRKNGERLQYIEIAVEEAPLLPEDWDEEVPLSTIVPGPMTRLVLFRMPMTQRGSHPDEISEWVWATLLERCAEICVCQPEELDPRI
ncbi:hypothetical protein BH09ACT10_BH09ACT10_15260 [soil metagenome]